MTHSSSSSPRLILLKSAWVFFLSRTRFLRSSSSCVFSRFSRNCSFKFFIEIIKLKMQTHVSPLLGGLFFFFNFFNCLDWFQLNWWQFWRKTSRRVVSNSIWKCIARHFWRFDLSGSGFLKWFYEIRAFQEFLNQKTIPFVLKLLQNIFHSNRLRWKKKLSALWFTCRTYLLFRRPSCLRYRSQVFLGEERSRSPLLSFRRQNLPWWSA